MFLSVVSSVFWQFAWICVCCHVFFFGGGTRSTNGTRNRLFESYMYMYDLNINVYPLHSMYKLLGSYSDF